MLNNKELLEQIDQRIRLKATGKPEEFAERIGVSKRTIFRLIESLKNIGCPVCYDRYKETYKYKRKGRLVIKFEEDDSEKIDINNIKGGFFETFLQSDKIWHYDKIFLDSENLFNV